MLTKRNFLTAIGLGFLAISLTGCFEDVDYQTSLEQEAKLQEAKAQTGLPTIVNFTEKKLAKMLIELRDEQISTYSYISTPTGLNFVCRSIGYGLPYSTQYTNPERYESAGLSLPQAEPNGLFMPSQADATWVLCSSPKGVVPVYVEALLVVSPFELNAASNYQKEAPALQRSTEPLKIAE